MGEGSLLGCRVEGWRSSLWSSQVGEGSSWRGGSSSGPAVLGLEQYGERRGKAQDRRIPRTGRGEHYDHILFGGQLCLG